MIVASQKATLAWVLEQSPCQTIFILQNKDLCRNEPSLTSDANCQVVTVGRRLRQRQTTLPMLLELPAELAGRGLTRDARVQPVKLPP